MAERKTHWIYIDGTPVEVSSEVYRAFYCMDRQERSQEEKKQRNSVVSYDALDTDETTGAEMIPDMDAPTLDEIVIAAELQEKLHRAMELLSRQERELIQAIYFQEISAPDYARSIGWSVSGVNKKREKILSKLKIFMNNLGSF